MCDSRVLSHKGSAMISRCSECQCVFIWNNNVILSFTPKQFSMFKTFIDDFIFDDHTFPFPDGEERVMMRTPVESIQLAFTPAEWDDFQAAMEEAMYMSEIYEMMEKK